MEKTFPGIKVYIGCHDNAFYLLQNEDRIIKKSELKDKKHQFAYVRELVCDMKCHPIEEFMLESDIPCGPIVEKHVTKLDKCVLLTNGIIPVKTLTGEQIKSAINYIRSKGCEPRLNDSIEDAGWVIGVECDQLYQAGAEGKMTTLIPTGLGENLYKKMFPSGEILRL